MQKISCRCGFGGIIAPALSKSIDYAESKKQCRDKEQEGLVRL